MNRKVKNSIVVSTVFSIASIAVVSSPTKDTPYVLVLLIVSLLATQIFIYKVG